MVLMELILESTDRKSNYLILLFILIGVIVSIYGYSRNITRYELFSSDIDEYEDKIIVFYQPSCPHCINKLPTIIDLSNEYNIVAINILNNKNLAKEYDIKTVPTLFLEFNNSSLKVSGSQSKEEIISYINQIKEGDFQNLTSSSSNEETQLCNINQMTECEMEMNLDD